MNENEHASFVYVARERSFMFVRERLLTFGCECLFIFVCLCLLKFSGQTY